MRVSTQSTEHTDAEQPDPGAGLTRLRNGLVGGIVAALLSFVPLSEVLGGAVAGYLDWDDGQQGAGAGAIAGTVAFLPYLAGAVYVATASVPLPGPELAMARELVVAVAAGVALVYVLGLSVLGGLLGGYVRANR